MKNILSLIIIALVTLLLLEAGARTYFSFKVGPSVFLYGTSYDRKHIEVPAQTSSADPSEMSEVKTHKETMSHEEWKDKRNVSVHEDSLGNYSKYFSNQKRVDFDIDTGESFDVTINNKGFRGEDFTEQKKPGVIRILTLGASSTFGYYDRDNETYPVYLEQILNKRWPDNATIEVINLGIPHLKAENILDLFLAEGIVLDPDVVTFYEGNNDAEMMRRPYKSIGGPLDSNSSTEQKSFLLIVDWVKSFIDSNRRKRYKFTDFQDEATEISNVFLEGVKSIYQECNRRNILFIVANQQKNSQTLPRSNLKNITYQEEVEMITSRINKKEKLTGAQVDFLAHSFLVKDLEDWAKENQVPFVDAIAELDNDRDVLVSKVHLSPKGNRLLADAFANKILSFSDELNTR